MFSCPKVAWDATKLGVALRTYKQERALVQAKNNQVCTLCQRSLDPFYTVTCYIKCVKNFNTLYLFTTYKHCNNYTWVVKEMFACIKRLRSTHEMEFPLAKILQTCFTS